MTPEHRKARGERAQRLLDDEMFQDIMSHIEGELTTAWKQTKADEIQRREDAWRSLRLLHKLKSGFRKIADDGHVAAQDILLEETRQKGPKRAA